MLVLPLLYCMKVSTLSDFIFVRNSSFKFFTLVFLFFSQFNFDVLVKSGLRSNCDRFGVSFPVWLTDLGKEYNFFRFSGDVNACIASTFLHEGVNPNDVISWPDHSVSSFAKWNFKKKFVDFRAAYKKCSLPTPFWAQVLIYCEIKGWESIKTECQPVIIKLIWLVFTHNW